MAERNFLAFDLGAESGRAMIGKLAEGKLTLEERHRFSNPNGKINGHFHWNLLAQWEELKTGLRKSAGTKLDGIGVDTWGVDFGLLGRDGELLGNPYMYRDARTDGVMDRILQRIPRKEIFEATGIQFMQINSLFQLIAMRESRSSQLEAAQTLLFVPDLFNYLFTGVKKSEFSIATTSQMYDPRKKEWAWDLLKKCDLPTHIFPEVVPMGTTLGDLRKDVAEECGVTGEIPVIAPGCHDTASAVVAVPASGGDDWCFISSGTWSLMGVEIPQPIINEKTIRYNYTNEGGINGSIRLLKNIMGLWPVQECKRYWAKMGEDVSYGELTKMAGGAKAFASLLNLDDGPFLKPGEMPRKIEQYCVRTKQAVPSNKGEAVRACLESLAMMYRRTLEGLEDILGRKLRTIHIVGGGGQNELLNQMTADATGRTVIAGPVEATATGNVLVQAMAAGDVKSVEELRGIVRNSFDVKRYEPREGKAWEGAYARFRELAQSASHA